MNISYSWLQSLLPTNLSAQEVADTLTSIGLETGAVHEMESIPGGLRGLVVGHVLTCIDHPNSDHLHITTVDIGDDVPLQIVCGAPNVAQGQYVVVATVGTALGVDSDKPFVIKKSKIRGEESFGMICSEVEIGIGTSSDGIITLPEGSAQPGTPAATYYQIETDYCLEVDITPNRVDATSHYGVARDLAARLSRLNGREIRAKLPEVCLPLTLPPEVYPVQVDCPDLCPRFQLIRIDGIKVTESPQWLRNRLAAIGIRPINNVVDATNFVLHEYGQPLHCYDADRVQGQGLVVRLAHSDEKLKTLDGIVRDLSDQDIIIADAAGHPLCIGGVMGGMDSGASADTTSILIEAANFHPTFVRRTARRHAMNTDSSFRFERGLDPDTTDWAIRRAASLIIDIAGGQIASSITDVYSEPSLPFDVKLRLSKLYALIGANIPLTEVRNILKSLHIQILEENASELHLSVPRYRIDVSREVDVIEEVLRIYGYNSIPMPEHSLVTLSAESDEDSRYRLSLILSEQLVGAGFNEILNSSFSPSAYYEGLNTLHPTMAVQLLNPLSKDLNVMRQTLLFGGLESIAHNERRRAQRFYYFEWGHTYRLDATKQAPVDKSLAPYGETERLGIWMAGLRTTGSWAHQDEKASFAELKATVYNLMARTGISLDSIKEKVGSNDIYTSSLDIYACSGRLLGSWGIVSPTLTQKMDTELEVYFAELDWDAICRQATAAKFEAEDIPKYPEVRRDLSLLLDAAVPYAAVADVARSTDRKQIRQVELFDVYEGKNLPVGKKSYALSLTLRDDNKTMSEKQIDAIMQKVIRTLTEELGASLR